MGGNSSLPSLSELLTKSVAELSEEVITLKLELEIAWGESLFFPQVLLRTEDWSGAVAANIW